MKDKRIHIILATTLFAILLWISINLSNEFQAAVTAPFVMQNIPQGKAVSTPVPKVLMLRFRGNGWRLAAMFLGKEPRFAFDVSALPGTRATITLRDVSERLSIPLGLQPVDMRPESVFVALDTLSSKMLPVRLDCAFSFREGYGRVGPVVVWPDNIFAEGAQGVLDRFADWRTSRKEFLNLKSPFDAEIPLADPSPYMLSFSQSTVRVTFDIQPFAEKTFGGLPVEVLSVAPKREVILIPPRIDIVVRGGVDQLSNLALEDFRAFIEYRAVLSDTSGTLGAEVTAPEGVQIVRRQPDRLQYIIRTRL